MNTFIRIIFASIFFFAASFGSALASEEECVKGDAKTVDEAFKLGVELAKKAGLELGNGEKKSKIHILSDKEHHLYIVKVCPPSLHKG